MPEFLVRVKGRKNWVPIKARTKLAAVKKFTVVTQRKKRRI